jgi:acyl carrier protein
MEDLLLKLRGIVVEVNEVFEKVKKLFVDELGIEEDKVTMEAKLEEDLDIDSLGIVEVVMAFEDEFEIEIDDEELTDVGTVGQAVNLLHSKL